MLAREMRIRDIGYGAMGDGNDGGIDGDGRRRAFATGAILCHQYQRHATEVVAKVSAAGFPVSENEMQQLAANLGEKTMFNRAGGAPTFAVGMRTCSHASLRVRRRLPSGITLPSCSKRFYFNDARCRHASRTISPAELVR